VGEASAGSAPGASEEPGGTSAADGGWSDRPRLLSCAWRSSRRRCSS